jgi:hypothetical protein
MGRHRLPIINIRRDEELAPARQSERCPSLFLPAGLGAVRRGEVKGNTARPCWPQGGLVLTPRSLS